ncbi:MAG: DUF2283 domain-containing protein [Phycisphaerales bacterium]|nr:DUF2283 domain-containing protein [Phycisphaerales bacterium]MCI0631179.1 DUF2283 domain-containing protein [Phycisphaerales bacterium]MCI0676919.1 DUF2283 domain-containing protein [Phycisphaerales bacterium]
MASPSGRYLEITYRDGRPIAGYLYLPRKQGDVSVRTERRQHGLLVDYASDGRPIGIEITAPRKLALEELNRVLREIHQAPASDAEIAPLAA